MYKQWVEIIFKCNCILMVSLKLTVQEKNIIWLSTFATQALTRVFKCEQCDQ